MTAIHIKSPALSLRAGKRALTRIREQGLQPADVAILPGAAGGPKGLGIQGLDLALFGDWLPRAPRERTLIGASIGSWRFASACLPDPCAGIRRLGELYTSQRFAKGVSMAEVSRSCVQLLDDLLEGQDAAVLDNPLYRLNIVVVRSHGLLQHDHRGKLGLGLSSVIGNNLLSRSRLGRHFDRIILHDARQMPPLGALNDFRSHFHALGEGNLRHALLASGSIPMVMEAIREIPGLEPGAYRDGGLLDYHLDLPYQADGVVLYPHFTDKVIPGWFDKSLPWRRADRERLQDVLLLAPSAEYLAGLPHGKLPDRSDFKRYLGDDQGRERYWHKAMAESRRLGDKFSNWSTAVGWASACNLFNDPARKPSCLCIEPWPCPPCSSVPARRQPWMGKAARKSTPCSLSSRAAAASSSAMAANTRPSMHASTCRRNSITWMTRGWSTRPRTSSPARRPRAA